MVASPGTYVLRQTGAQELRYQYSFYESVIIWLQAAKVACLNHILLLLLSA
jgi:hypothetical protein